MPRGLRRGRLDKETRADFTSAHLNLCFMGEVTRFVCSLSNYLALRHVKEVVRSCFCEWTDRKNEGNSRANLFCFASRLLVPHRCRLFARVLSFLPEPPVPVRARVSRGRVKGSMYAPGANSRHASAETVLRILR